MRPTWEQYFVQLMEIASTRANCNRAKAGAVIVRDNHVLTTGYVGAPSGIATCDEAGHIMQTTLHVDGDQREHCVRTAHAEANAIAQAAKLGVAIDGATLYCRMEPCLDCTKLLINSGIVRVVAQRKYHAAQLSRQFLDIAGIELKVLEDVEEKGDRQ